MSEKYVRGEKVRITIEATVQAQNGGDELEYQYPSALGTVEGLVVLDCSPVTVERVAPAEWPPRPGDLWRDRHGSLWFAVDVHDIEKTDVPEIVMVLAYEDYRKAPEELNRHAGPLVLVHREEDQS